MGIFDKVKKTKNAKWTVNRKPTLIDLKDNYIHFEDAAKEYDIFYKDIKNIEKEIHAIKLKTNVKEFKIIPKKVRGAGDISSELYSQLMDKISINK